jgi:hypothetical protein
MAENSNNNSDSIGILSLGIEVILFAGIVWSYYHHSEIIATIFQ